MRENALLIIGAFGLLETKHLIADFVLQSGYQVRFKGVYGHPGGLAHAGIHALASIPIFLLLPASFGLAVALIAAEFVLHYHIDWAKSQVDARLKLQPSQAPYWRLFGFDQWLHHMTYLGYLLILA